MLIRPGQALEFILVTSAAMISFTTQAPGLQEALRNPFMLARVVKEITRSLKKQSVATGTCEEFHGQPLALGRNSGQSGSRVRFCGTAAMIFFTTQAPGLQESLRNPFMFGPRSEENHQ